MAILAPRARSSTTDGKRLQLTLYEFQDTAQYTSLESCIVRHQPKTVYIAAGSLPEGESQKLRAIFTHLYPWSTSRPLPRCRGSGAEEDLANRRGTECDVD